MIRVAAGITTILQRYHLKYYTIINGFYEINRKNADVNIDSVFTVFVQILRTSIDVFYFKYNQNYFRKNRT